MSGRDQTATIVKRTFLKLLPMQILGVLVPAINGFIDSFITGQYLGTDALAAIGFFAPVGTAIGFTWVVTTGIQMLCSQAIGSGDRERVVSLFSTGVLLLSVFGLAVTAVCLLFSDGLSLALGAKGTTAELLSSYIRGYAPGIVGQVLSTVLMVFLPFNNDIKRSYYGIGVMVVSNIALDLILVAVMGGGCFAMGMASSVSYLLSTAIMLRGFIGDQTIHLRLFGLSFNVIPMAIFLGLPDLMYTLGCTAKGYILNLALMNDTGDAAVAVMNVQNSIVSIFGAVPQGYAGAFLVLAGLYFGDEDSRSLEILTKYTLKTGLLFSSALSAVLIIGSGTIPYMFFSGGEDAWFIAQRMLLIFPVWLPVNLLLQVILKIYHCQGQMTIVNFFSFAESVLIAVIASVLLGYMGSDGAWISFAASDVLCLIIIALTVFARSHRITFELSDWMKLRADFGCGLGECMEFSIHSMEDVINISEKVMDFCSGQGLDHKRSMIAGLAIEEMAGNVVEHGFVGKKSHAIDVRIVARELLTIRIRDDCEAFDPQKYMDQFAAEDPTKNIGLRIITGMAQEISYQNNAGINTLLVRI